MPTQQALRHLDRAFRNFFERRAKYPTFHQKHRRHSAEYTTSAFRWNAKAKTLTLAKMETPLAIRWSRPLPDGAEPSTVTVSFDTAGRYFVSLLIEEEIASLPPVAAQVGIDLGLHDSVVFDTGEKVGNPRFFSREERRLAKALRQLAKKQRGSKNRAKTRAKVTCIHAQISDRRRDFLHQLSTRIIRENQTICVESLHVKAMVKHPGTQLGTQPTTRPRLAKAIHDVGWGEFVRQLTYKAAWYGRTLIAIDQWFPSSKRCSACRHVLDSLPLEVRAWACPAYGAIHDRDLNAARNIKSEGLRAAGHAVSACGEAVRPGTGSPVVGGSR